MANQRTIDEILGNLPSAQKETVQNLRILIKNNAPETVEFVKNEKITYKQGDKDFFWISHFQDHVDLEFAMGASLDSNTLKTRGVAEKNGNTRHISISNFIQVKSELAKLVKQAAVIGLEHCPTSRLNNIFLTGQADASSSFLRHFSQKAAFASVTAPQ